MLTATTHFNIEDAMRHICLWTAVLFIAATTEAEQITPRISLNSGPVNQVVIRTSGGNIAVYGSDETNGISTVLLTHHRRDVVQAAQALIDAKAKVVAPVAEEALIAKPQEFWDAFTKKRYHDYQQQSTKILTRAINADRWVKEGDAFPIEGVTFRAIDTPGYTRGAVTYIAEIDGKKIAFTGDIIYGNGQIFDLYSFQDKIPEARIGAYHGYASRLSPLIASLRKVAAEKPDIIVPARGPVIRNPQQSIDKLIGRVQAIYKNYISTNALHWYFKEERMRIKGERVLGKGADIELMPYCTHKKSPDWVWENSTSRLIISEDGHGFLLDCGNQRVIDAIRKLMSSGLIKKVDGIFVTHTHDDHSNMVQAASEEFKCPIYSTVEYEDILEHPGKYHMPGLTHNVMPKVEGVKSGHMMKWREFELTFHFYPGQMFYHGGLFVRKKGERPIFFIGDSFAPSGIDDYCLLNRNLLHANGGFRYCLKMLRDIKEPFWLVNEHIPFVFNFSDKEMTYLETRYAERIRIISELVPWDHPNYAVDEQWAVCYPYGVTVNPGDTVDIKVRITNHSPIPRSYTVTPHLPGGAAKSHFGKPIELDPEKIGDWPMTFKAPTRPGNYVVTADIQSTNIDVRRWVEALITVE